LRVKNIEIKIRASIRNCVPFSLNGDLVE
jgi:hypothetical protein